MAQSLPLRPVATLTAATFKFPASNLANVAVHFFDASDVLVAGGSVQMSVTLPVTSHVGPTNDPTAVLDLDWTPENATITIPGGEFRVVDLGDGGNAITLTPLVVTPPGGATQYTISVSGRALNVAG